jgi:hypothetical protein
VEFARTLVRDRLSRRSLSWPMCLFELQPLLSHVDHAAGFPLLAETNENVRASHFRKLVVPSLHEAFNLRGTIRGDPRLYFRLLFQARQWRRRRRLGGLNHWAYEVAPLADLESEFEERKVSIRKALLAPGVFRELAFMVSALSSEALAVVVAAPSDRYGGGRGHSGRREWNPFPAHSSMMPN